MLDEGFEGRRWYSDADQLKFHWKFMHWRNTVAQSCITLSLYQEGGQIARAAGTYAQLMAKGGDSLLRMRR
jgi:hypothetical protein